MPAPGEEFEVELETEVRAELRLAESGETEEEVIAESVTEWRVDPADAERYAVGLKNMLGATEAMEEER